jgi:DsbC/DsbD-like thiol-disulfide interchange protein
VKVFGYRVVAMHRLNVPYLMRVSSLGVSLAAVILAAVVSDVAVTAAPIPNYEAPHTRIRLLTAGMVEQAGSPQLVAGIEITLEPGWKTYWRSPGEGIPPSFSWDESANLKAAEVLWPVPVRFTEAEGTSIGYKGRVVLPVVILPEKPDKSVSLSLSIAYGVCKDICMPVEAQLSIDLDAAVKAADRHDVLAALARVPRRQEAGGLCPHRLVSAKLIGTPDQPRLRVETAFEPGADARDLLVEAPQESGLGSPTLEAQAAPGQSVYLLPLPPEGIALLKEKPLGFTTVSDRGSCESHSPVK